MESAHYEWGPAFQLKLLALQTKHPTDTYDIIDPAYFTDPIVKDVSRVVHDIYRGKKDSKLTRATLLALLKSSLKKSDKQYWTEYKKVVRRAFRIKFPDKETVVQQAFEFAKESKFRDGLIRAEQDINNRKYDAVVKRFQELLKFGKDKDVGIEMWQDLSSDSRFEDSRTGVVPTGFKLMDKRCLGGGLGAGELGVILAPPKVGKTTTLANIAAGAMKEDYTVGVASAELSDKKYRRRLDCILSGVANSSLRKKKAKIRRILKRHKRHQRNIYFKQFPSGKATVDDIERWLDDLEEQGIQLDLLIVDYIGLLKPKINLNDRRQNVGSVAVDLRGLAVTRKIPVWTASQTNRAAMEKDVVGPKDFAEDISQFWTLDFLVAVCQSELEARKRTNNRQRARFFVVARDYGSGGVIKMDIHRWEYEDGRKDTTYRITERPLSAQDGKLRVRKKRKHAA